ncbi:hypothetical protein ACTMU2_13505 [Cupriavidus basilensis]
MKVAIIGGGPSGLFLSILLKERMSNIDIDVFEQDPEDATFGFGVVLADTGLSNLRSRRRPLWIASLRGDAIQRPAFDRQPRASHRDEEARGRGGAIPRISLLSVLQERAKELGVRVTYNKRIADFDDLDADLVVGADGIGSQLRTVNEAAFGTTRRTLTNHFAWFGVAKPFASPALVFRKYEGRYFVAHYYPYSDSMSTFVAECDHQTWVDFGMEEMSAEARRALFEKVFAPELAGHWLDAPTTRSGASSPSFSTRTGMSASRC